MEELSPDTLSKMPLPRLGQGDKKARGTVLVIGGSLELAGTAKLSGLAALRVGAGRLRIATCRSIAPGLGIDIPEALVSGIDETTDGDIDAASNPKRLLSLAEVADCVLIGPGMANQRANDATVAKIMDALPAGPKIVLDARAILSLRKTAKETLERHAGNIVITPHPGEMASFLHCDLAEVEGEQQAVAVETALQFQATVVLKSAWTVIASPTGESASVEGCIGLATSGSGDVLAGVIAGLLARGAPPYASACWGAYIPAAAGKGLSQEIGPVGFLAREILPKIPKMLVEIEQHHPSPEEVSPDPSITRS